MGKMFSVCTLMFPFCIYLFDYLYLFVKQNASFKVLTGWQIVNKFFTPKKLKTTLIKVVLAVQKNLLN